MVEEEMRNSIAGLILGQKMGLVGEGRPGPDSWVAMRVPMRAWNSPLSTPPQKKQKKRNFHVGNSHSIGFYNCDDDF